MPITRYRFFSLSVFVALAFVIVASSFVGAEEPATRTIVKFNVPGAGTSSGQGTQPFAILADGSILGGTLTQAMCITASCALLLP
jgi:hypothetical protein